MYLNIAQNELQYTTDEKKPELILTVKDSDNNPITTIDGLTYDSTLGGFDITEASGTIAILDNREIKVEESNSKHQTIENWNITITMINLNSDQSDNAGKNFKAEISIQKDKKPTFAESIENSFTEDGAGGLYYHDGVGTYGAYEAGDNSYRFVGANPNNYVCFGSTAEICPDDNLYRIIGIFDGQMKLIKYDYATSDQLGINGDYNDKVDHGSTYKGKQTTQYRYYWNKNESNTWSQSNLYSTNLNTNFKKYLQAAGKDWTTYIDGTKTWKVGGNSWANIGTATNSKTVYTNEITSPAEVTTVTAMFGLIYVSDYRYATDPGQSNSWSNLAVNSYNLVANYNWMYMGETEWTISRHTDTTYNAFYIYNAGDVKSDHVNYIFFSVRPTFYLKSSVELKSGTGTSSDPYRIA